MKRGVEVPRDTSKRLRYADPFSSAVLLPMTPAWMESIPSPQSSDDNPKESTEQVHREAPSGSLLNNLLTDSNDKPVQQHNEWSETNTERVENVINCDNRGSNTVRRHLAELYPQQQQQQQQQHALHLSNAYDTMISGSSGASCHEPIDRDASVNIRSSPQSTLMIRPGDHSLNGHIQTTSNAAGVSNIWAAMPVGASNDHRRDDLAANLSPTPITSPTSLPTTGPVDSSMLPLSPNFVASTLPFPRMVSEDHVDIPKLTGSNGNIASNNQGQMQQSCRTIYLGGLLPDTDARAILDRIRAHGVIESVRMLPERGCAFVSFLSAATAAVFHAEHSGVNPSANLNASGIHSATNTTTTTSKRTLVVNGQEVKVSWGKPSPVPLHVLRAAEEDGATRAVFLADLTAEDTEARVRQACEQFGEVETLRWLSNRRMAFAHFTCIADAVRCVAWFATADDWVGRRVHYGRDRCMLVNGVLQPDGPSTGPSSLDIADISRSHLQQQQQAAQQHLQLHQQQQQQTLAAMGMLPGQLAMTNTFSQNNRMSNDLMGPNTTGRDGDLTSPQQQAMQGISGNANTILGAASLSPAMSPSLTGSTMLRQMQQPHAWMTSGTAISAAMQSPQPQSPSMSSSRMDSSSTIMVANPMSANMPVSALASTAANGLDQSMLPPSPDHRTIYLGNLKRSTTVEDLCNVIRGGALERIRLIPEKRIAFVSFISANSAADFHRRALYPGLIVKHQRLRPGWGRPRALPAEILRAVSVGASRNVYLGGLEDPCGFTVERLRDDFAEYGEIELVNTLPERQCAFVNFTGVAAAVRAVDAIRDKPGYERVRVNFGKDRCANPPRPELDATESTPSGSNHATTTIPATAGDGYVTSPAMSPTMLPKSTDWLNNSHGWTQGDGVTAVGMERIADTQNGLYGQPQPQSSWPSWCQPASQMEVNSLSPPTYPLSPASELDDERDLPRGGGDENNYRQLFAQQSTPFPATTPDVSLFSWGTRGPRSLAPGAQDDLSTPSAMSSLESRLLGRLW